MNLLLRSQILVALLFGPLLTQTPAQAQSQSQERAQTQAQSQPYAGNPVSQGKKGNDLFDAEAYAEASEAYRSGIRSVQEDGPGRVHAGLLNNLGASLYRQGEFESAAAGFASSVRMAPDAADRARGLYNAGNALVQAQKLEDALEMYKEALLEDPTSEDAKHNYELARRQLDEQQQQQQQEQDGENEDGENNDQQNEGENEDQGNNEQQDQDQDQEQEQQQQQQNDGNEDNQESQEPQDGENQPQQNPETLTREEAERMLEALQNQEEQLLREVQKLKTRPRRVDKDW